MSGLEVIRPGPLSLLQDGGRFGWQHLGVAPGGPLDGHGAAWANRLLGNRWGTPLLEIALGGVELLSRVDTWVAVCGAALALAVDGQVRSPWTSFPLRAGQRLTLGFAQAGQRAYLAVAQGFQARQMLGSAATQTREGLGGLQGDGRPLQAGDLLACVAASGQRGTRVPWPYVPNYQALDRLRVIAAGEGFAAEQIQTFLARPWRLSPQSDRMGARLLGEPLRPPAPVWSRGMASGAIQVPPDGQPIILQADRQTMGGYPVLGWLHPLDLWRLAQCPAHRTLRFESVALERAQAELLAFYRFFR